MQLDSRLITKMFFRMIPVQILLVVICGVNIGIHMVGKISKRMSYQNN